MRTRSVGLKIQIMTLVIFLVAGLVAAISWTVIRIEKQMVLSDVLHRGVLEGRNVALASAKALLGEDPEFQLHPLVTRALAGEKDLVSIVIVDRAGRIKGHRHVHSINSEYQPTPHLEPLPGAIALAAGEEVGQNDDVLEVKVPVSDRGEPLGAVYLQYSKHTLNEAAAGTEWRMLRIGAAAIIAGALVSLLLAIHITRPVEALTRGAEDIGLGLLETRLEGNSIREIDALADGFNAMAEKLDESRRAMLKKERMERELEIAHEIQATLLPSSLPHLRDFEVDAYYHPATEVGGDYFDLIPLDKGRLLVVVGDVAGKGVPGLVVMAMVRILVRALALEHEAPAELLRRLNALLGKDIRKSFFVTLFCGILDTADRSFAFASAAHMPLIVYHAEGRIVNSIGTSAKPLAVFPDAVFAQGLEEHRITLRPGDCVVQFTDGLNEMRSPTDEEFGLTRLMQAVAGEAAGGARHLVGAIRRELAGFRGEAPQSDDLTIVAISAMPAGVERASADRMDILDRVLFE